MSETTKIYCDDDAHCWHGNGQMLLTDPPQIDLICCHCGMKKRETINNSFVDTKKHGLYAPRFNVTS